MIPILNPDQFLAIICTGLLITIIIGIPTAFLSLLIFFVLERIPFRWAKLILPAAGVVLMLSVSLGYFSGIPQSPEEYQRTWVPMMLTSFVLNAMVVLVPFPFFRSYIKHSPYIVIPLTLVVTFFLLTAFGFMGGEAQIPPDNEFGIIIEKIYFVITECVIVTLVYGCIALLGITMSGGTVKQD